MKRNYGLYLKDILNAMESIEKFVGGMTFTGFIKDDKTTSAVIQKLEVLGEAAKHLPDEIRHQYPQIPWKEMAGMRDRLIHFYFGVDYNLIWETVSKRIPEVKPLIKGILEKYRGD